MKKYLETCIVRNVHGIKGDVTVSCLCDSTEVLATLKRMYIRQNGAYVEHKCTRNQPFGADVNLIHLEGYETREDAVLLKGVSLYADRDDLPKPQDGTYYIADLIGLPVIDADNGNVYGKITDVNNYGASDIYEVTSDEGKVNLIPAVKQFVIRTDVEKGVYVRPIEGLFE